MKKCIFFLMFISGLFLLHGCGIKNKEYNQNFLQNQPEILIQEHTGEILIGDSNLQISGEYGYYIDKETGRKFRYITGFKYIYLYKDLGLKIETSRGYENYSYQKYTGNILKRYQNIIYNAKFPLWFDYIQVFDKDPNTSFEDEIIHKHLGQGCKISTGILDAKTSHYNSLHGFYAIYLENIDGEKKCQMDKQFPQREMPIIFVINPKHPERYYKIGIADGCAPGPCSIFGDIEFF